jgi:hypothetical protein
VQWRWRGRRFERRCLASTREASSTTTPVCAVLVVSSCSQSGTITR